MHSGNDPIHNNAHGAAHWLVENLVIAPRHVRKRLVLRRGSVKELFDSRL